jgi:cytochrome c-type biogenesis protein CcmH
MNWLRSGLTALMLIGALPAFAVQPDEILPDATMEQRARALSRDLRCMVCQNQSIDDSDAPLARDLRLLVRERLKAGDSDGQVIEFLTVRYGDFVLLNPRFTWRTGLLWLLPAMLLIGGAIMLVLLVRRQRGGTPDSAVRPAPDSLSEKEKARLAKLIHSHRD